MTNIKYLLHVREANYSDVIEAPRRFIGNFDCLINSLFRLTVDKLSSKLWITGLLWRESTCDKWFPSRSIIYRSSPCRGVILFYMLTTGLPLLIPEWPLRQRSALGAWTGVVWGGAGWGGGGGGRQVGVSDITLCTKTHDLRPWRLCDATVTVPCID